MSAQKIASFLLFFLFSFNAFAQNPDDVAKQKILRQTKLLDQILTDAKSLRLPENRALVLARVGSAYWKTDEKQARKLFQEAAADLITAQSEAENEKSGKQYFQALIYGQSPRLEILNLMAVCDAELALEVMAKTRPAKIAQALNEPDSNSMTTAGQYAASEIATEQHLVALAAEQNPQTATKRIRESLKKGATYETLNLLRQIYTKDAETANQLAAEVVEDFLKKDLSKNQQTGEIIGYFICELGRDKAPGEKSLSVPDKLIRDLSLKLTDNWLDPKTNQFSGYGYCNAIIQKLFPDRFAQVKQKLDKMSNQSQTQENQEYTKITQSETPPDEMVARAENFSPSYRNEIYRIAADKYAQNGNLAQAERILSNNISADESERYLSQFYANLANQAASQGKFETANSYANQISDENQRMMTLIYLAQLIFQKDQKENRGSAIAVLEQVRALISDPPENQNDFNGVVNLITAYAEIDPNESFRLLESLTPPLNEIIQANFVLAKFRSYGGYRQGELEITNGNYMGVYNLEYVVQNLKNKDFDRALQFTNGFTRPEIRIKLEMQLIDETLLNGGNISNLPISGRQFSSFSRID
jgi:hypothetical protein